MTTCKEDRKRKILIENAILDLLKSSVRYSFFALVFFRFFTSFYGSDAFLKWRTHHSKMLTSKDWNTSHSNRSSPHFDALSVTQFLSIRAFFATNWWKIPLWRKFKNCCTKYVLISKHQCFWFGFKNLIIFLMDYFR